MSTDSNQHSRDVAELVADLRATIHYAYVAGPARVQAEAKLHKLAEQLAVANALDEKHVAERDSLEEQLEIAQRSARDEKEATERFWNENARLKEQLELLRGELEHAWGILSAEGYADDPDWSGTRSIKAALDATSNPARTPHDSNGVTDA